MKFPISFDDFVNEATKEIMYFNTKVLGRDLDMEKVNMSAPWIIFIRKLEAFFLLDPDIHITYDPNEDPHNVNILVDNAKKYDCLSKLMDPEVSFGNFNLKITIIPANFDAPDRVTLFKELLRDMSIVDGIDEIQIEGTSNTFTYISFRNEVVKYWSDNLGNPHGNSFTLYETLANDIFPNHDGVMFTTAEE